MSVALAPSFGWASGEGVADGVTMAPAACPSEWPVTIGRTSAASVGRRRLRLSRSSALCPDGHRTLLGPSDEAPPAGLAALVRARVALRRPHQAGPRLRPGG